MIKAISWLTRSWSLAIDLVNHLNTHTVHTFEKLLDPAVNGVLRIPDDCECLLLVHVLYAGAYLFIMFISSDLVVRSIDFMMTLFLGVRGELASFKGLKLKMLVSILLAAIGRRCISTPNVLSVAVTSRPSLFHVRAILRFRLCLSDL